MNCKPGDLARVVRSARFNILDAWLDKLVVCQEVCDAHTLFFGTPIWHIEPLHASMVAAGIDHLPDQCLRPIRDPGPDAVDETLLKVPTPMEPVHG